MANTENGNGTDRDTPLFRATRRRARAERAAGGDAANGPRAGSSMHVFTQMAKLGLSGAALGQKAAIGSLRGAMPMFEFYAGTTRAAEEELRSDSEPGRLQRFGFSPGEVGVLQKAFGKGVLEAIEISSVTHPIHEGAPVYMAHNPEGGFNRPTMAHLLALGAAATAVWQDCNAKKPTPEPPQPEPQGNLQPVIYVASEPGKYIQQTGPFRPTEIRSFAMRQRNLNPPPEAMLLSSSDPNSIAPANAVRMMSASAPIVSGNALARANTTMRMASASMTAKGCACGGKGGGGCSCGSGRGARRFPPARYDEDGECAPIGDISCETKWRVRECFKIAFCDFLRCLGEQYCESKEPDLGECLDDLLCSLLTCLPEAICQPEETCEPCCPPMHVTDCNCNFAVGE